MAVHKLLCKNHILSDNGYVPNTFSIPNLCLDAYWILDPDGSEVSVETGLKAQAVREQKYTLGGGANIIANLAALNPAEIKAIGAVGDDMFGYEMFRQFKDININIDGIVKNDKQFNTIVYAF